MNDYTIAVLGCGNMGKAVTAAILGTQFEQYPSKIICCNSSEALSNKLKKELSHSILEFSYGSESNKKAVASSQVIILGCKPYMYEEVYNQVKDGLTGDQLIISLLAGTTTDELRIFSPYVSKVLTNTPAQYGCGMAAVCFTPEAQEKYSDLVMKLINPVGKAIMLPEKNMDAATALVGSAPAFCLVMMEAMIEGGVRMGIPYETSRVIAAKVMEGTGAMVDQSGEVPASLKSKICTPGGTTIGGLLKLEDAGVRGAISRAVEEAANISKSFAKK